ncbi:MAG: hypothetical protein ABEJ56_00115 [Candidatus Nanohaloarchaea archaeon]
MAEKLVVEWIAAFTAAILAGKGLKKLFRFTKELLKIIVLAGFVLTGAILVLMEYIGAL